VRHWLPELAALPLYPLLLMQGRHARRVTPRLPEASGPTSGMAGASHGGTPLTLLTIGESPVAGVGVGSHEEAITGCFAAALAERLARPVAWQAHGRNGVTVREAMHTVLPQVPAAPADIVLVAFGVNDTTAFRSASRWRADLQALLRAVEARCSPRLLLLSGVPPVGLFPALPHPLRWVLGMKARSLDLAARELVGAGHRALHVPLELDPHGGLMASDGFHPSHAGCLAWAAALAARSADALGAPGTSGASGGWAASRGA